MVGRSGRDRWTVFFLSGKRETRWLMAHIGILTHSNATQDRGCSSVSCLADVRKRRRTFKEHPADEPLDLVGIINCPGCPTLTGPDKLLLRIRALTEFRTGTIHFANCIKALCPFRSSTVARSNPPFPASRSSSAPTSSILPPSSSGHTSEGCSTRSGRRWWI